MSGRAQRNEVKVGNFQNQSDKLHAEKIVEYCFSRVFPFTHCKVTCKACLPVYLPEAWQAGTLQQTKTGFYYPLRGHL